MAKCRPALWRLRQQQRPDSGDDFLYGENGDDLLFGDQGSDTLLGFAGSDQAAGGGQNDVAVLGEGDDVYKSGPGDANDTVEGGAGADTFELTGGRVEDIVVAPNGSRVRVLHEKESDVSANTSVDMDDVETINLNTQGDADAILVDDLTGTGVIQVNIDLLPASPNTSGRFPPSNIIINATNLPDEIFVTAARWISELSSVWRCECISPGPKYHATD